MSTAVAPNVTPRQNTAERIVNITGILGSSGLDRADRIRLQRERTNLWDREYPGQPYEAIQADLWRTRIASTRATQPS